ncbi:fumarate hydratase [Candidatus Desantisbacteria bacterium CG_4_10_14_0_8_um_filter_48_22]|uniref:Fumarate hydratase n=1 Tax=Candidatus Desantisbacteria bacterium CG_4_10_14_0_8_um_filter_48_22 TaxID=1974543 RepID=A0A2M7SE43_9BACT|nr:MAG: fumarate hydratase [Candidatus Desantisbacteria bacterium CG1_02_49_89]PIV57422.1 MAG: fumarate hydratase [Candidatus Desantisbacteria bacterium CG02_land_8_20_14_3_00_49_13]PIZ17796.1 MAG: fumarate hydratase [Candidatus Desantisbacteria bacterium CG_4_10_14_0_8_um_filter_48_22]
MKIINASKITDTVAELCMRANYTLRPDVKKAIQKAAKREKGLAGYAMDSILKNIEIAEKGSIAMCQDTGMAVVFLEIGQDLHIKGNLEKAIQEGVRSGYRKGCLRASVVEDPFGKRVNTGDNTPAVIHTKVVPGSRIKITVLPKGFGSENTSTIRMFLPGEKSGAIEDFIVETVKKFGPNACPPLIVGVGIGGTSEKAMVIAKEALLKPVSRVQPALRKGRARSRPDIDRGGCQVSELANRLLRKINALGIGPGGFGGKTTALGVNIETFPTHIAGLPVAINISCWALRKATTTL